MPEVEPPYPTKQLAIHQLLVAARQTVLHQALGDALKGLDPSVVAAELAILAPNDARRVLAQANIRDEHVFATPVVLTAVPTTLGYYRLLLGVPQKQFYTSQTKLTPFKPMEEHNRLPAKVIPLLTGFCSAFNRQMAELITLITPDFTRLDLEQLPLVTLGVQFDGKLRNDIGQAATQDVFLAIREIVAPRITSETSGSLTLVNSSGRKVRIELASDPDVAITEEFPDSASSLNVALEIKGGHDRSNAHNRAGEAEKSHLKLQGHARDHWTLIAMKGMDQAKVKGGSPTTRRWYEISEVLARTGDWERFKADIRGAIGI